MWRSHADQEGFGGGLPAQGYRVVRHGFPQRQQARGREKGRRRASGRSKVPSRGAQQGGDRKGETQARRYKTAQNRRNARGCRTGEQRRYRDTFDLTQKVSSERFSLRRYL